jgi:hypothetical protein
MTTPEDNAPPRPEPELPSYLLEDDAEPVGWRRWLGGWRLLVALGILTLAVGALVGAKPAYLELKARRALTLIEQAGVAFDRGDAGQASTLLRQAALMAYQDERVAAHLTYHAARAGDMASVGKIGKRFLQGKASTDEILVFGERCLAAGDTEDAARALAALPSELAPAQAARRAALQAGLCEDTAEAKKTLRDALAVLPVNETSRLRLMLAGLLLGDNSPPEREEARDILEALARDEGAPGAMALRLLAMSRAGGSPEAQRTVGETLELLRRHPASQASDETFIARLTFSCDPSKRDQAVASLVAHLKERDAKLDDRVTAAGWLIGLQAHEAVLDLIGPDELAEHAGALMVRIDALGGLGRWDECEAMLDAGRKGSLPDTLYHMFRAHVAGMRGDKIGQEDERRQLRKAMKLAELPHVSTVARYAESVGWKPEAFAAWRIVAADVGVGAEALRAQLRNLPPTSSAAEGMELANALLGLQPDDPTARLTAAYYQLLAGQNIVKAAATAREFLESDPASDNNRGVAALACLREGQAVKGLELIPSSSTEDRWRAIHAALLQAAGRHGEATMAAREINRDRLESGEVALLRDITP